MGGTIFGTLGIGWSGLKTSQSAVDVTSNNISNANNEYYTRQRVVIGTNAPLTGVTPGDVGQGSQAVTIQRVTDEFVYKRYRDALGDSSYYGMMQETLQEVSKYFPDMEGVGLQNDLAVYFKSWQSFAQNPNDTSQKVALARNAETLATSIRSLSDSLETIQQSLNDRMESMTSEINNYTRRIAEINARITSAESDGASNANDLRDERDKLETALTKLIAPTITKDNILSDVNNQSVAPKKENYVLQIGGFTLVDGSASHDLKLKADPDSPEGFYNLYYERQDHVLFNASEGIKGGQMGALFDLRGSIIDPKTGTPSDGEVQKVLDNLNTFAKGLINATNNIYATSAQSQMISNYSVLNPTDPLVYAETGVKKGSFDIVVYDENGKEVSKRTMAIADGTTINDVIKHFNTKNGTNTAADIDDNLNNSGVDDVDDMIYFDYTSPTPAGSKTGIMTLKVNDTYASKGYRVAVVDNGSNFPATMGLGRFFDGEDAHDMTLKSEFANDSSKINGYGPNISGNNTMANAMIQLQYDSVGFDLRSGNDKTDTLSGFYRYMTSELSSTTSAIMQQSETQSAYLSTVQSEYESISKVSTDEELTNLIKFQTGYSAAAKVITTIDEMINTLLGIKQ